MVFISCKKFLMFLRYLNFRLDFFYYKGKQLNEKAKVNNKFMRSQTGQQIILIHI